MRIAIIIVSWESGPDLQTSVGSAVASLEPGDEIIIWDNASSAPTKAILDELEPASPAIRVHHCDQNIGFAAGNNAAIEMSGDASAILCLNPDAELTPGALRAMREVLSSNDSIAAVGAIQLGRDQDTIDGLGDNYHLTGLPRRLAYRKPITALSGLIGKNPPESSEIFSPCAAVALYRRSAIDEAGGFDQDFFCYCEDVDLGFRLRLAGWICVRANGAIVLHTGSASTGVHSDFSIYHGHRNLVWMFVKNMPASLLVLLLPAHLAMNLATLIYFTLKGRGKLISRAKAHALRQLGPTWKKRKRVQATRRIGAIEVWRVLGKGWY